MQSYLNGSFLMTVCSTSLRLSSELSHVSICERTHRASVDRAHSVLSSIACYIPYCTIVRVVRIIYYITVVLNKHCQMENFLP